MIYPMCSYCRTIIVAHIVERKGTPCQPVPRPDKPRLSFDQLAALNRSASICVDPRPG